MASPWPLRSPCTRSGLGSHVSAHAGGSGLANARTLGWQSNSEPPLPPCGAGHWALEEEEEEKEREGRKGEREEEMGVCLSLNMGNVQLLTECTAYVFTLLQLTLPVAPCLYQGLWCAVSTRTLSA